MQRLKEKLNDYKDAVIGNGIYDLIKQLLGIALGGTATPTILHILIRQLNIPIISQYKIPIIIIITIVILIIILEFYERKFKHVPSTPEVVRDYDVIKRGFIYIWSGLFYI